MTITIDYNKQTITQRKHGFKNQIYYYSGRIPQIEYKKQQVYRFLKCFKADEKEIDKIKIYYKRKYVKLYYHDKTHIKFEYFEDIPHWIQRNYKMIKYIF